MSRMGFFEVICVGYRQVFQTGSCSFQPKSQLEQTLLQNSIPFDQSSQVYSWSWKHDDYSRVVSTSVNTYCSTPESLA
jgi:hypothetical protein